MVALGAGDAAVSTLTAARRRARGVDVGALIREGFALDAAGPVPTPAQCQDYLVRLDAVARQLGPMIFGAIVAAERAQWDAEQGAAREANAGW